jgi:hypothetical protein
MAPTTLSVGPHVGIFRATASSAASSSAKGTFHARCIRQFG